VAILVDQLLAASARAFRDAEDGFEGDAKAVR
jgi:hypothetical protein